MAIPHVLDSCSPLHSPAHISSCVLGEMVDMSGKDFSNRLLYVYQNSGKDSSSGLLYWRGVGEYGVSSFWADIILYDVTGYEIIQSTGRSDGGNLSDGVIKPHFVSS